VLYLTGPHFPDRELGTHQILLEKMGRNGNEIEGMSL
jgi:hypothetical protein